MKTYAVIGAAFGDEGKGLITDWLAYRNLNSIVVRYNGGAQAGHTVVMPEGRRHVFHHFGAGTLAGCQTYLSRYFIVNPFLWVKERDELKDIQFPTMKVSPRSPVTTPYDMLVNQELENSRGANRHGSCGIGINETVNRSVTLPLLVSDLYDDTLLLKVEEIRDWALDQFTALGIPLSDHAEATLASETMLEDFLAACDEFAGSIEVSSSIFLEAHDIIFEGAQGLLLDESHKFFPHVTRSRTGMNNVATIMAEIGRREIETYYVMRTYMTRHGRGPFPSEDLTMKFEDTTNAPNDWQGTLRFGQMDFELIADAITVDIATAFRADIDITPRFAITHSDQIPFQECPAYAGLARWGGCVSSGPTRRDVREVMVLEDRKRA